MKSLELNSPLVKKLFGTDGVRGPANRFPMTPEVALALGKAAAIVFRRHSGKHKIIIGKDTRLSCYSFENALIAGLCSMGVDTLMVGPLPTPGVAFMARAYRADAAIMISASHNPYQDNGIKFFSREGLKLSYSVQDEIERLALRGEFDDYLPENDQLGKNSRVFDAYGRYIEFAKATFGSRSLEGIKIVLDCAHGAAYNVGPLIFSELDASVISIGVTPDGLNINDQCGSLYPRVAAKEVLNSQAHVGICLDGDADRVIMIDEKGNVLDGDIILAICARYLHQKGQLPQSKVVATVMSNLGMVHGLEAMGIEVELSKVGDRHVIERMQSCGAIIGGEQSGHLVFMNHNTTGDGIVAALQVLRIMVESGRSLSDLASEISLYSQTLINVVVQEKRDLSEWTGLRALIDEVEKDLGAEGRVFVRYSGTELLLRILVESRCVKKSECFANKIANFISDFNGAE